MSVNISMLKMSYIMYSIYYIQLVKVIYAIAFLKNLDRQILLCHFVTHLRT